MAWFHPPACATSFAATLFHYANASLPRDEGAAKLSSWEPFWHKYNASRWFRDGVWYDTCDHAPVTDSVYEEFRGHFAGLFRDPAERIVSRFVRRERMSIKDYAKRVNGSVALQLTGVASGEDYIQYPDHKYCAATRLSAAGDAPPADIALAIRRLEEGFMFVGLFEQYDLSVCLFHAMFGGECLPVEFENMRKRRWGTSTTVDALKGLRDIDQTLYDIAKERFWADVEAYGVDRRFCRRLCANASHIFGGEEERRSRAGRDDHAVRAYAQGPEYDWPGRWVLDDDADL